MLNQTTSPTFSTNNIGLCSLIVQEKWNMQILSQLVDEPKRYSQIEQAINSSEVAKISPKILSRRLKQLCENGLLNKQRFSTIPPSVQYELTNTGELYIPVLMAMSQVGSTLPPIQTKEDEFNLGLDS